MKKVALAATVFALTTSLQAAKLAGDDFSYGVGSPITSANGGFGWSGAWTTPTTTNTTTSIVSGTPSFSYTSGGTLNVPASQQNGAFQVSNTGAGTSNTNALSRSFSSAVNSTDIYVSFMVRYTAGTLANAESFYLYFGTNNDANARYDIGVVGSGTGDIAVRTSNAGATTYTAAAAPSIANNTNPTSGSYFVVGRLSKTVANYNSFTLWSNPTSPIQAQNTSVTSSNATGDFNSFTSLGFGFASLDNPETFQIDNLQIGTTWQDVITPVPFGVDSTLGLALLGGAAALRLRRKARQAR